MKKILRFAMAFAMALSITACAGSGRINWDAARQVKPGMTSAEVEKIMGRPYMVASKGGGVQTHVWTHATAFGGASSMSVSFKDGIASSVPEIPKSF